MAYKKNFAAWPPGRPHNIAPATRTLFANLEHSYQECADKTALVFYETEISYRELYQSVLRMASWLHHEAGVNRGDRVAIFSQNCPQYVIAYYATLAAGAVVVPLNPMYVEEELTYLLDNSGARVLFAATELGHAFVPVLERREIRAVAIEYQDYLRVETSLPVPDFVKGIGSRSATELAQQLPQLALWADVVNESRVFERPPTSLDDLVMLPYTSGSTGNPKGCMHDHHSTQHALRGVYDWFGIGRDDVILAVAPMFHVVGLQAGMNTAIACGCTAIILPRWDRQVAAHAICNYRVTVWPAVPTMIIDLINMPDFSRYDISSLRILFGGGSTLPEAVAAQLKELCGVAFMEGYGMTETCCPGTANPVHQPRPQCAGIPVFNTHVRIVDHDTLESMADGEVGEVLISGPQILRGYWQDDVANAESFVELDGRRYLRTGDLGYLDAEGYLYVVDRIKRMINASGFKVWPTQVEAVLYRHPAIAEVCVIASQDPKRGETVKALVVVSGAYPQLRAEDIIEWSREHMAAYKIPRLIEFVPSLPKSGSGKVLWRQLQEEEKRRIPQSA